MRFSSRLSASSASVARLRSRGRPEDTSADSSWVMMSRSRPLTRRRRSAGSAGSLAPAARGRAPSLEAIVIGMRPRSCRRATTAGTSPASIVPSTTFPCGSTARYWNCATRAPPAARPPHRYTEAKVRENHYIHIPTVGTFSTSQRPWQPTSTPLRLGFHTALQAGRRTRPSMLGGDSMPSSDGRARSSLLRPGFVYASSVVAALGRLGSRLGVLATSRLADSTLDLFLRDAHHLGHGGDAGADLLPAVLSQRPHPLLYARVLDDVGRGALQDERPDHVVHQQELEDARAPAIPGPCAVVAALTLVDLHRSAVAADLAHHRSRHLRRPAALRAHLAHQALGEHPEQRGGEQVVLHPHLEETRHGARRVVGVQGREDEAAGERRLDRDLGRLGVADLAHHDDIGVLADDRAQPVREGEPDLRLHVDLIHAEQLVLDRILDGDELLVGRVDLVERPVERGRLAAAGGAGHQDHAVGLRDQPVELRERVLRETERPEGHDDRRAVEDAEHDTLAVERGEGRDAEIDLAPHEPQLDAPVLRQAPLGDVELRHDLDARHDRRLQPPRRCLHVVQHAVDAVADLELVLEGLDVDVRGALLDRAADEQVHEANDRRLGGEVAQVVAILLVVAEDLELRVVRLRGRAPRGVPAAVDRLERFEHVALAREARLDLEPGGELEALDRVVVGGGGHRHGERAVRLRERQRFGVLQELEVQVAERQGRAREIAPVDGLDAQVGGEERKQVLLGDETQVEEETLQPLAPLLLEPLHLAQVVLRDAALLDQELLERAVREFLHGAPSSIPACFPSGKHGLTRTRAALRASAAGFAPGCPPTTNLPVSYASSVGLRNFYCLPACSSFCFYMHQSTAGNGPPVHALWPNDDATAGPPSPTGRDARPPVLEHLTQRRRELPRRPPPRVLGRTRVATDDAGHVVGAA